jgi:uncharacterized membrane protein
VLTQLAEDLVVVVDVIGTIAIAITLVYGLGPFVSGFFRRRPMPSVAEVRNRLGRGLVLTLEIFIAADLLRSILSPTLADVAVLGAITFIRIALSLSLEHELRGLQQDTTSPPPS